MSQAIDILTTRSAQLELNIKKSKSGIMVLTINKKVRNYYEDRELKIY